MKTIQHRKNEINEMGSGMINEMVNTHEYLANILKKQEKNIRELSGLITPPFFKEKFSKLKGGVIKQQKVKKTPVFLI